MIWTFHPKNKELTTSLPLSVEVRDWKGKPSLSIDEVGEIEFKPVKGNVLRADFYLTLPGTYQLRLKDSTQVISHSIDVKQHTYLDFSSEFGFFFTLFLIVMGGIILWTRSIMRKKTPQI